MKQPYERAKKSQSAMEFISLASFMLLLVVGFFAAASSKILQAKEDANTKIAEDIAEVAYREISIAESSNKGYKRTFTVPQTVNGVDYSIKIIDDRELIVTYIGYEYVKFLPSNIKCASAVVCSNLKRDNTVSRINESVVIS